MGLLELVVGGGYIATMPLLWVVEDGVGERRSSRRLPLSGSCVWLRKPAFAVVLARSPPSTFTAVVARRGCVRVEVVAPLGSSSLALGRLGLAYA